MKILLVEDNTLLREAISEFLIQNSHECIEAAHGGEGIAVAQLEDGDFDFVITDFHMPVMDGVEFLRSFQPRWPGVPILLMTANPMIDANDSSHFGADHFLSKPLDTAMLLTILNAKRHHGNEHGKG